MKRIEYLQSAAYNMGYADGARHAIQTACKLLDEYLPKLREELENQFTKEL